MQHRPSWKSTNKEKLLEEGLSYFAELFHHYDKESSPRWFPRIVSEEMNLWMIRMLLDEEVRRIVFSLASDKAPGPDGCIDGFFH